MPVVALLVSKPGGTILGGTELGLENSFAILGAVYCLDTALGVLLFLESNIDSQGLIVAVLSLPVANRNLLNVAILPKELGLSKGLE